jgi:hypothetical protein
MDVGTVFVCECHFSEVRLGAGRPGVKRTKKIEPNMMGL